MDNHSKEVIQEVITYLLGLRHTLIKKEIQIQKGGKWSQERIEIFASDYISSMDYVLGKFGDNIDDGLDLTILNEVDTKLISLNSLLSIKEKVVEAVNLEEEIKKIQAKKNITVKEFAEIYNISRTSQQNYRARLNDPLPYHQKVEGGKIVYVAEEVENWFVNQHK